MCEVGRDRVSGMSEDLRRLRDLAFQLVASKGTETLHAHQVRALAADYLRSLDENSRFREALRFIAGDTHDEVARQQAKHALAKGEK